MIEASCSCSMQVDNKAAVAFLMRYLSLAHSSSFIADLKKVDADIRVVVTEAADFATTNPEPDVSELYTDIYKTA